MTEPCQSLLADGRLVAYVYRDPATDAETRGVHRAGCEQRIADLDDGRVEVFSRAHEALMARVAEEKPELEGFLFRLQVEGLELREGRVQPVATIRRF